MRFAVLIPLPNGQEGLTVAKALLEKVFGIFGPPEILLSDMGPDFENKVVRQLQEKFGHKKPEQQPTALNESRCPNACTPHYTTCCRCIVTLRRTTGRNSYHLSS